MLNIIFGRAGSGKTTYLQNLVLDFSERSIEAPLMIVPEQFSFETERKMLGLLKADKMNRIKITSFSHLASSVCGTYAALGKPHITDAERAALMSMCVEELSDTLEIYGKYKNSPDILMQLVGADKELRQCGVQVDTLLDAKTRTSDGLLKTKLGEIALICETYRARLGKSYADDTTALDTLARLIAENGLFCDKIVMLDGFRGFTAQEMRVFTEILKQARAVYITVCAVGFYDDTDGFGAFSHTVNFAKKLRAAALEHGVAVAKPVSLPSLLKPANYPAEKKCAYSEPILALEYALSAIDGEIFDEPTDSITIAAAADMADESDFVACEIRRLIRTEGYRCRDICIIERTEGSYKPFLINALHRYDLPVFDDARRAVSDEPLICAVCYALESVVTNFSSQSLMRYLKTGLTDMDLNDVCLADNFTVVWDIDGAGWKDEWKNHPSGLGFALDEKARTALDRLNNIRRRIVAPLLDLKNASDDTDGLSISKAVFSFIEKMGMSERLYALAKRAEENGEADAVRREQEVWDALVRLLEQTAQLLGDRPVTLKRYAEIFRILCAGTSLGVIPQGLDELTIGAADRIRTGDLRAVFLVGVNDGVFPQNTVSGGVFSESDRKELYRLGVEMSLPIEERAAEERFIAYGALTAGQCRLTVSYSQTAFRGESQKPSEIVALLEHFFPNCLRISTRALSGAQRIEGGQSALNALAQNISGGGVFAQSLKQCLSEYEEYAPRLEALSAAFEKRVAAIDEPQTAKELFGKDIPLSASKLEQYYECPFRYFCKYGLSVDELKAAALDPTNSGSAIHFVLEKLLSAFSPEALSGLSDDALKENIKTLLDEFLEVKMGGTEGKSPRFLSLYYKMIETVTAVVTRLKNEFSAGRFVPVGYELSIGGDIAAYCLEIPGGGSVRITGSVDRVDIMEKNGKKYIRVIDYKTGSKEFKLSEVLMGINLQMCLYLSVIEKNGAPRFGETIPAGVLYLPSRVGYKSLEFGRNPDKEKIERRKITSGQLSGMILNEYDVIEGMGYKELPDYLPVKEKKGEIVGNLYTAAQFGKLASKVDSLIVQMGCKLHAGNIPALPAMVNDKKPCRYCSYTAICGFEEGEAVRDIALVSHDAAMKSLEEEYTDER